MMKIVTAVVFTLFVGILIKEVYYIRDIIVPTRKSTAEIIEMVVGVIIFSFITYKFESQWYHYVFFVIAVAAFICMCLKHGISSKGFLSQSRGNDVLYWDKINKVNIVRYENKVKLIVSGKFNSESFYFKNADLDKIINVLKEHGIELNFGQ